MKTKIDDCYVCRQHPEKKHITQTEGGVTTISLHNAHVLVDRFGRPDAIILRTDTEEGNLATMYWHRAGESHTFSGFGWGYGGTGPTGLWHLLVWLLGEVKAPPMSEIASWPMESAAFIKTFIVTEKGQAGPGK